MKSSAAGLCLVLCSAAIAGAQATATASRAFDFQVGGGYSFAKSDYSAKDYKGGTIYTTLDFTPHFGVEFDIHQVDAQATKSYERTYEFAGRYHRNYGRFAPYAKVAYGRGVFNFVGFFTDPITGVTTARVVANLAYNEGMLGVGTDFAVRPWLNLRADYEYQSWFGFQNDRLTPQIITFGAAYHFPGTLGRGRHF